LKKLYRNIIIVIAITGLMWAGSATPFTGGIDIRLPNLLVQQPDTTKVVPPVDLKYEIKDASGNPLLEEEENRGLDLNDPSNLDYSAEYDYKTGNVTIYRKVGNMDVRLPYTMPLEDYINTDTRRSILSYWREKQNESALYAEGGSSLLNPSWNVGGEAFESIFGSNKIDVRLQGMAELKVGINHTKLDNPTLQERMRKTTTFDFQEMIQMNITGTIGDKLKLGVNYNTEATFDFENQINLEYEGNEDDILKKVEAGNVTLPLPGTLITGSQSLFGVKTEMQFGKLTVTSIFSQQKGETKVMNIEGGAETQEFEIQADQYDRNRHFFLAHDFREKYNKALEQLPYITSNTTIQQIEVWVTNRTGNVTESRNVVAFLDLAETDNIRNTTKWTPDPAHSKYPVNASNNLYARFEEDPLVRDINQVTGALAGESMENAVEFEKLENARRLSDTEYTLNKDLGYISLNSALNADEVLAVAYRYSVTGDSKEYQVGEFSSKQNDAEKNLYLKLLKSTNLTPDVPESWNLMMKNIYSINAYQVNREDFVLDVTFTNDSTGSDINYFPEGPETNGQGDKLKGALFLQLMNLDQLDSRNEAQPNGDGIFDFVEGITIHPQNGRIIFPVLEPFGQNMIDKLDNDEALTDKYVYKSLYDKTQTEAEQDASQNKYKLKGRYKSSSGSEISLNAMNVPEGSVIVTAGSRKLVENTDYIVDYTLGRVRIINQGILNSGTPIQVSLENQSLFNVQTKTLLGTHLNYQINENFNIGGTLMHLRERPLTQKVNIGDEPIANTIWGVNTSFYTESLGLTELIDKLPLVQTKEPSSITFEGEFAQLIPGHPNVIDESGTSYIDDFEGTRISYDMRNWTAWQIASTPQKQPDLFPESENTHNGTKVPGYNRAKLAWYNIDPLFLRGNALTPGHIKADEEQQKDHRVREIRESELFPNRQTPYGQPTTIPVLNLAYYPSERGPYNFDLANGLEGVSEGIDENGHLREPESRWGGMMRPIDVNDFEAANIEYIEFWMMDPFVYDEDDTNEGTLYFNLGNVSEDILRDSRKSFEQGLPGPDEEADVDETHWGYVSKKQSLVDAFSTDVATRLAQDVGLDGMNTEEEKDFHLEYINSLSGKAQEIIKNDPASDDYHYFRGSDYDANEVSILDRYKNYNNLEGNSKPTSASGENYSTAAMDKPDVEDINRDFTLSENESYYQYKVELKKGMDIGDSYIVDRRDSSIVDANNKKVSWFLFRVPVQKDSDREAINNINNMQSIRFMRMFMTGFEKPTVLRLATLDLVRGDWRKYDQPLAETKDNANVNIAAEFEVSAVNIEENSDKKPVNYVLPPGIDRVIDPANPQLRELNEQSLLLKVKELGAGDARGVYKTMNIDIRQYKRLKMFIHAAALEGYDDLSATGVSAFVRLGSDYTDNYYEYEIKLSLTENGNYNNDLESDRRKVWTEENELNLELELLSAAKLDRNQALSDNQVNMTDRYQYNLVDSEFGNNQRVYIKGNPNLSNVKTIMMGIRNTHPRDRKSVEVWMNELRLTDFDEQGGWAANARMSVKLADLGNVSVAGKTSTVGWGSIDQNVQERSQEDFYQYDVATNLELGKFLGPESALSAPFYFGVSKSVATPKYYPLDPDIPTQVALDNADDEEEREKIKELSQSVVKRKSVNFTNVKVNSKKEKVQFYSPSNISATYSYNETTKHDVNTENSIDKSYRGILAYNYNARPKPVEPFKKTIKSKSLALVRDFNFYYLPSQISYRWEINRMYRELKLRNNTGSGNNDIGPDVSVSKDFDWNRFFDMRYNLTKGLKLNFRSVTNARIDEGEFTVINKERDDYKEWRDEVMNNILSFGRTTTYQHNFDVSYTLPINKIPLLDWTNTTVQYRGMYQWDVAPVLADNETKENDDNTIRNSNTIQLNGTLNMKTLYKKVSYLDKLDRKYRSGRRQAGRKDGKRTVRFNNTNIQLKEGEAYTINHRLKTTETSVRVFDSNGRPIRGESKTISPNKIEFTPDKAAENARIMVTGTVVESNSPLKLALDYSALLITSVKNITVNYSENNGTILHNYSPKSGFMGTADGFSAPGAPFIFGWQDRNFAKTASDNGWLAKEPVRVEPYVMTHKEDFSLRINVEPIRGLRLDLNAERSLSENIEEIYTKNESEQIVATNFNQRGNFSMTFNLFKTAFKSVDKSPALESELFQQFKDNRKIIHERLGGTWDESNPNNDSEVLIPAFLAAYSGKDANKIFTDRFPGYSKMQPNWRISYDGLSRIKAFKKIIKSFDISHAYRSTYNMGSYILTEVERGDALVYEYDINSIMVTEQFSPLIEFNITWTNNITTRAEIKKSRALSLSMGNNQVIEDYKDEYVIGLGYRFDKMDLIFGKGSSQKSISNDLNLRVDFSIRNNLAMIRKIEENYSQMTNGSKVTTVKFTADYALSDRFNMQLFYDTNISKPYITTYYPRQESNFGVSFRFALTQ